METLAACNLCGSARFIPLLEKLGAVTKQRFGVVRCAGCGLVFVNPRLTEAENAALYDEAYFRGSGFDTSVDYVMLDQWPERREESLGIVEKIRLLRPGTDVRVLDVGCGTGAFLRVLRELGYDHVTGLELSSYAADVARRSSGAPVIEGDLVSAELGRACFDVINATEVVEHVRDPRAFFAKVRDLLAPGGIFIYSTGNERSAFARLLGKRWPYIVPEGHLYYFSPATIRRYFEQVGLEVIEPDLLSRAERRALLRAEDSVTHAQLGYVGRSDRGLKGAMYRTAARFSARPVVRLATRLVGKHAMPIGRRAGDLATAGRP
ncbi:MAG: class I SAM-dependent methyltransferase [Acidobacteriota bacterium]